MSWQPVKASSVVWESDLATLALEAVPSEPVSIGAMLLSRLPVK